MRLPAVRLIAGIALASCFVAPSFASDESDVMAVVKAYLADMNTGDVPNFTKLCAPQVIILDDFPPQPWQGANACTDWLNALVAYDAKTGVTPEALTIGAPRRLSVDGDHAYVVLPAGYKYRLWQADRRDPFGLDGRASEDGRRLARDGVGLVAGPVRRRSLA